MNINKTYSPKTLKDIPLFSELSVEQLRKISAASSIKNFAKNEFIFFDGDAYRGFYILLKGVVKIFKITAEGKETIVHVLKPFSSFADILLFEGGDYPVNAQAVEECMVLFIPKDGFIELLKNNHEISLKMLAGFAKRLQSLVTQIEDLQSKEVHNRLAKYILTEIKIAGTEKLPEPFVKLSIPKSIIAGYLGTITETLSRAFKRLLNENIIRVHGKTIFVKDIKRLKDLAK